MHAGKIPLIRPLLILALALAVLGCGDSQMTLLDEELNKYRYDQEQYRRESLEDLYFEETMRCEDLTIEILEARRQIEDKTRELGEIQAQLAEIDAQLARAKKDLAAAEKAKQPRIKPSKPPAKAPSKQPAKQPAKAAKPPEQQPPGK